MSMKAYVLTSGLIFGLLAVAHVLRIVLENRHLASEPFFVLVTLACAALALWAAFVIRPAKQSKR
jgi:hypothetical protein